MATSILSFAFILTVLSLNFFLSAEDPDVFTSENLNFKSTGGPAGLADKAAFLVGSLVPTSYSYAAEIKGNLLDLGDGAVLGLPESVSHLMSSASGLRRYRVKAGDTLSSISSQFGVSVETIRWANDGLHSVLRVGQDLVILPVSGILYEVTDGDTLDSVAGIYQVNRELIKEYNPDYQKIFALKHGYLILPYAKPRGRNVYLSQYWKGLPDIKNYFVLPAAGWNWGELHEYNAVDIANRCGTPIYAAAEGLVVPDDVLGDGASGWNNGYGLFVLIEHPNGTKTRYAHLKEVTVRPGDFISQGEQIGTMGNSGNTHGPTGCHLHFEVLGAKNPFAVR